MFSEVYKMMRNAIFLYLDTCFVASIKVYVVLNDNFVLMNSERELLPPLVYPLFCSVSIIFYFLLRQMFPSPLIKFY